MPFHYEIDEPRRLVNVRAWGVVTYAEAAAMRLGFTTDPAFKPDFNQLIDCREIKSLSLTISQLGELASDSPFTPKSRRAFVAQRNFVFGILRMIAVQFEIGGALEHIRAFRTLEEAEVWLDLKE